MHSTKVSVIVPSYNGAHKLPNILKALEAQTIQDFETVVVVDGSTDNTREVLEGTQWKLKDLNVVYRQNGGRAVARNVGVAAAQGDLLVFFDDDVRPIPECLALHVQHAVAKPHTILVGPPFEDISKMKTDFQLFRAYLSRTWLPVEGYGRIPNAQPFITAADFSLSKSLFDKLGGFDKRLNDAEDFDLAVRAVQQQIPIYFNKDVVVWHDDFVTCRLMIKRHRQYRQSYLTLQTLKPDLRQHFNQYEPAPIGTLKKTIYWFFSQKFWLWSIDKFNWLRILPKKVRYKIYNIVLTGYSVYFINKKI
ncbi:glycosyltransferase family 2 protein [Microscilla marina]|uniref:Glucosyltransferase n=1 Tax=Microscilla marina ATCC 23134 TaxID=313606 RepID=A1ZHR7_MICM2|nr:glycosyltransferase family 2 protein [Microscilla marina]EAY30074.1 glucosyltransferase [Microscilla marina ATCC 23134]